MRSISIVLVAALTIAPVAASARGFDMSNDVSAGRGSNGSAAYNHNTGNAASYNKNTGTATTYNKSTNTTTQYHSNTGSSSSTYHGSTYNNNNAYHGSTYNTNTYHGSNGSSYNNYNSAGAYNKNTGNAAVYNKNTGNMTVYNKNTNSTSTYHYNTSGTNGYYYTGHVVASPVYYPAWGWNHGAVWAPYPSYWGGGFWGAFAVGAATAATMGYIMYQNQKYTSYAIATGSPGAILLSNYGLQQVPCGPPGQVVIYGPNFGIICANPNARVAAGSYAVNTNTLTLQSQ